MFMFSNRSYSTASSEFSISSSDSESELSVFSDDTKDIMEPVLPQKLRFSAQQLAASSASQHFPTFINSMNQKCGKLHWACHVGWCLCKYQYQPLTPLHLLPNTPITDRCVALMSNKRDSNFSSRSLSIEEKKSLKLLTEGASSYKLSMSQSSNQSNESL